MKQGDGFLVRNFESCEFLQEKGIHLPVVLDLACISSTITQGFWERQNVTSAAAPLELNEEGAQAGMDERTAEVYGYIPVMISAQCIVRYDREMFSEQRVQFIKDRMQEFAVKNCCDYCYNVMYNCSRQFFRRGSD